MISHFDNDVGLCDSGTYAFGSGKNTWQDVTPAELREMLAHVSQPTWGVDVGAAAQIRGAILALRDTGCAVLVVSEELDELFEVSDRLHVISRGQLSPSVPIAEATIAQIGEWMSGLWDDDVQQHLAELEGAGTVGVVSQAGGPHAQA